MKLVRSRPETASKLLAALPALDIVILFVVFFVLSSNFVLQHGVAVTPPSGPFTLAPLQDAQIVTITGPPVAEIYFNNQRLTVAELTAAVAAAKVHSKAIVIKADRHAPYELVLSVAAPFLKEGYSVTLATTPPGR